MSKHNYLAAILLLVPAAAQAGTSTIKCQTTQEAVNEKGVSTNRSSESYFILDDDARTLRVFIPSTGEIGTPCNESCRWTYDASLITFSQTLKMRTSESQTEFELNRVTGRLLRRSVTISRDGMSISRHQGTCNAAALPPVAPPKF